MVQRGLEEDDYLFRQAGEIRWCLGHSHPAQKDSAGGKIAGQFKCAQSVAFPSQMRLFYKLWVNYKHC